MASPETTTLTSEKVQKQLDELIANRERLDKKTNWKAFFDYTGNQTQESVLYVAKSKRRFSRLLSMPKFLLRGGYKTLSFISIFIALTVFLTPLDESFLVLEIIWRAMCLALALYLGVTAWKFEDRVEAYKPPPEVKIYLPEPITYTTKSEKTSKAGQLRVVVYRHGPYLNSKNKLMMSKRKVGSVLLDNTPQASALEEMRSVVEQLLVLQNKANTGRNAELEKRGLLTQLQRMQTLSRMQAQVTELREQDMADEMITQLLNEEATRHQEYTAQQARERELLGVDEDGQIIPSLPQEQAS